MKLLTHSNHQRLHRWSLGMDALFHPTLYWVCDYLFMLGLKLIHISKRGIRSPKDGGVRSNNIRLISKMSSKNEEWYNLESHTYIYVVCTMTSQWASWRLKSPATRRFIQIFVEASIKENIKIHFTGLFLEGIRRWPVDSPHKGPVTQKALCHSDIVRVCFCMCAWVYGYIFKTNYDLKKLKDHWHLNIDSSNLFST